MGATAGWGGGGGGAWPGPRSCNSDRSSVKGCMREGKDPTSIPSAVELSISSQQLL